MLFYIVPMSFGISQDFPANRPFERYSLGFATSSEPVIGEGIDRLLVFDSLQAGWGSGTPIV